MDGFFSIVSRENIHNVDHHVIHIDAHPQNRQPLAIGLKLLIMIDNYASYNKNFFLKQVTQPMRQANCASPISSFYNFFFPHPISTFLTILVLLLILRSSTIGEFLSTAQLTL